MTDPTLFEIKNELQINSDIGMYYCGKRINTQNHTYGPEIRSHYLFVLVNKGTSVLHGETETKFGDHDLLVMCPGQKVYYTALTPWNIQWVGLYGDTVSKYMDMLGINAKNPIINISLWKELEIVLSKMYDISNDNSISARLSLSGLIFEFFSILFKSVNINTKIDYVSLALKIINYNFNTDLSVTSLAKQLQINSAYFTRIFTHKIGVSPKQYILDKKINRAQELLTSSDYTIIEISNSVGIFDQLYFSRIFKKKTGMSPSAYRKSYKKI